MTGQTFGLWTVASEASRRGNTFFVACRCACGTVRNVRVNELRAGRTQSCGCKRRRAFIERNTKHGATGSREWKAWQNMRSRCKYPYMKASYRYVGRGIEVRYKSFDEFLADVGPSLGAGYSVDRINNDGHYEPGNCRWSTSKEQCNNQSGNRLLSHDGITLTVAQWAERLGLNANTLEYRIIRGWSLERALASPTSTRKGEDHARSKLTEGQVISIRSDTRRTVEVANAYSVSRALIDAIRKGRVWRHV